jgi:hypothetical protein
MKLRTLLLTALLVLCLGVISASAREVTVMNGCGFTIKQLGLVDANSKGDAQDLLGQEVLENGEGLTINIEGGDKGWELIAVDNEGTQVNWQNLDLTGVSKITLKADGTANLE